MEEKQGLAVKAEDLGSSIFVRITIILSVIITGAIRVSNAPAEFLRELFLGTLR